MCGICGIYNFNRLETVQAEALCAMNQLLVHRGPDDGGQHIEQNVGLASRRLTIVDLKSGHQPLSNEDGNIWIAFNGEIYNHAELRIDLEKKGHRYRTRTDTETIVHLYEEYGLDCVRHLRGMFAFAIWDAQRQQLFCARDRFGIKPFYFHLSDHRLVFASEIKAILKFPGLKPKLDTNAVPEYLAFGYLSGAKTLFEGVQSLLPGHWLVANPKQRAGIARYWDLPQQEIHEDVPFDTCVLRYRDLLDETVRNHLMSDAPVGMLLSGGLDSSLVAALMQRCQKNSIQTFSVGYPEFESSELPMARRVARHLRTEHHEVTLTAEDFFRALPRLIWHEDEPLAWPSSVPLYFVCQRARENVKVVLTGEGSDETQAGYDRYGWTLWNKRFDAVYRHVLPSFSRRWIASQISGSSFLNGRSRRRLAHTFLGRDGSSIESLYFDNFYAAFSRDDQNALFLEEIPGDPYQAPLECWDNSAGDFLARLLSFDLRTYLVELLMKQDNMSMAASIESRVPFLDHVLAEYTLQIPSTFRFRRFRGKQVLRAVARDLLPREVIEQRKRGFPTPWRSWLSSTWMEGVERLLFASRTLHRGIFRPNVVRNLLRQHRDGLFDHSARIWRLLNLELWHRVFIDADPSYCQLAVDGVMPEFAPARVIKSAPKHDLPISDGHPGIQRYRGSYDASK